MAGGSADKAKILDQAQKFLLKGNVDKAVKAFQELLEIDPRDRRIRLRFADLLAKVGKRKEAVAHYEQVAATYVKDDFVPQAIAVYKTITRLDPERHDLLEKLADLYKSQGLEGEASTQLQLLYEVYSRAKNEDGQVRVLRRMVDTDPENLGVQVRLGETLAKMGCKQEAAEAFARAASTLSRRGFHERASSLFERIIALNPRNSSVRKELCAHYLEAGQFSEARREVDEILALEPEDARMVLLLGRILYKLGEKEEARRCISRSLDIFVKHGELEGVLREYLFVAQTHLRLGDVEEAETFFREVHRVAPAEVGALRGLVQVAESRSDVASLLPHLRQLAQAQAARGERKGARDTFARVLELAPEDEEAGCFLAGGEEAGMALPDLGMPGGLADFGATGTVPEAQIPREEATFAEIEGLGDLESLIPRDEAPAEETSLELDLLGGEEPAPTPPEPPLIPSAAEAEDLPGLILEGPEGMEVSIPAAEEAPTSAPPTPPPPPPPPPPPSAKGPAKLTGTMEELLVEADLYARYGLYDKAADIFAGLLARDPSDARVLAALYQAQKDTGATEAPATGRRWVTSLLDRGQVEPARRAFDTLKSDYPSSPEAALLAARFTPAPSHAAARGDMPAAAPPVAPPRAGPTVVPPAGGIRAGGAGPDPFREDLEEADFYLTQGLTEEAVRIYRSVLQRSPRHPVAKANLESLVPPEEPAPAATSAARRPAPSPATAAPAARPGGLRSKLTVESGTSETSDYLDIAEELRAEMADELESAPSATAEEGPVTFEEIFAEFKKGIAETLGDQEYETHYNLGIAYKDMGLLDDAIRELQIASRDPKLFHDSLGLMAMCFMERGDLSSARASLQTALTRAPEQHRAGLTYQLGQVQERSGDWQGALASYQEVRRRDPAFPQIDADLDRCTRALTAGTGKAADLRDEDVQFENLFADLIREVGDLAEENRRAKDTRTPPDPPPPVPGKKQRISYL
jgi:tetratricopeptide (TPR) repeat protein